MKRFAVSSGDILMSCSGTIGKLVIIPKIFKRGIINQALLKITPNQKVTVEYLRYALQEYLSSSNTHFKGMAIKNIASVKELKKFEIPLPPLEIQKKIVERIEKLMGKIDTAKNLRKEAMADASALIPSALNKIFEEGKAKGWEEKVMGDVLEKIVGGGTPSKSRNDYWGGKIPWASVKDIKEGEMFLQKTKDFITKEGLDNSSSNLISAGTLIISTRMGLGRIVKTEIDVAINQDLKAIFPKKELNVDYLFWFYKSKSKEIIEKGSGATVSGVRLEQIKNLIIPLPPLPEQQKIVKYLDSLSEKVRKIQALQSETEKELKLLEKGILNEAFGG